jgi:hypothetical protein
VFLFLDAARQWLAVRLQYRLSPFFSAQELHSTAMESKTITACNGLSCKHIARMGALVKGPGSGYLAK